jgi:hypothetical protein
MRLRTIIVVIAVATVGAVSGVVVAGGSTDKVVLPAAQASSSTSAPASAPTPSTAGQSPSVSNTSPAGSSTSATQSTQSTQSTVPEPAVTVITGIPTPTAQCTFSYEWFYTGAQPAFSLSVFNSACEPASATLTYDVNGTAKTVTEAVPFTNGYGDVIVQGAPGSFVSASWVVDGRRGSITADSLAPNTLAWGSDN